MFPETTNKPDNSEDSAISSTPNVDSNGTNNPQVFQPNQPSDNLLQNTPSTKKSGGKLKLILLLILLAVLVLALSLLYVNEKNKSNTKITKVNTGTSSTVASEPVLPNVLLTYVSNDNSNLIVTNTQQKVIAKIPMPSGKTSFDVLADNGAEVLIQANTDTDTSTDPAPINYLISANGTITNLAPTSLSAIAPTSSTGVNGNVYLGPSNNLVGVVCSQNSNDTIGTCNLESIDLKSGSVTTLDTATNPGDGPGAQIGPEQSLLLYGVSNNNVAYYLQTTEPTVGTNNFTNVFKEVNVDTQKIIKTITNINGDLENTPTLLSPDDSKIAYTLISDSTVETNVIDVLDINTQQITKITVPSDCDNAQSSTYDFDWSYDSTKLGLACQSSGYVGYIDVATSTIKPLRSSGPSNTVNSEGLSTAYSTSSLGWTSNDLFNFYDVDTNAKTYSPTYYVGNITTNKVSQSTTPAGYKLDLSSTLLIH